MLVLRFTHAHRLLPARAMFESRISHPVVRTQSPVISIVTAIAALAVRPPRRDIAAVPNLKKAKEEKNKWRT